MRIPNPMRWSRTEGTRMRVRMGQLTGVRRYVCFGGSGGKCKGSDRSVSGTASSSPSSLSSSSGDADRRAGGASVKFKSSASPVM